MDKENTKKPASSETLRLMLNRIDGALNLLEKSLRLADGFGPSLVSDEETLTSLLKPILYNQAYDKCMKGEIEVYSDFIPKIIAQDIDKEKLIKKYISEIKK